MAQGEPPAKAISSSGESEKTDQEKEAAAKEIEAAKV